MRNIIIVDKMNNIRYKFIMLSNSTMTVDKLLSVYDKNCITKNLDPNYKIIKLQGKYTTTKKLNGLNDEMKQIKHDNEFKDLYDKLSMYNVIELYYEYFYIHRYCNGRTLLLNESFINKKDFMFDKINSINKHYEKLNKT